MATEAHLPERAAVHWRRPVDEGVLRRRGRWWTLTTICHCVPFILAAAMLAAIKPLLFPVSIVLLVHAWAIPELYAARGAGVLRPCRRGADAAERRALLMLGDLVDDANRRLYERSGLVVERGRLGTWLVGEAGAILVAAGGRRAFAYCVKATGGDLPSGDRVAHLLLALRCDETGFATVANLAFSGAVWRVRRRLAVNQRPALGVACASGARRGGELHGGLTGLGRTADLGDGRCTAD